MKFYFTNQTIERHDSRVVELKIEEQTGLELENPFYDGDAKEVKSLDAGQPSNLSDAEIVAMDLKKIRESDGVIAFITRADILSIGSWMEVFYCHHILGKPMYLISPLERVRTHPWAAHYSTKVFSNPYEFIKFAQEEFPNGRRK